MTLRFRPVCVEDLPVLFALRYATVENAITPEELEQDYGVTPHGVAAGLRGPLAGWLCEIEGQVAGFCIGDGQTGEVQVVAVHPVHEGLGVGAGVLGRVSRWLFSLGHTSIWLRTTPDPGLRAWGFYRHLGWRPDGETLGDDAVLRLTRGPHAAPP